METLLTNAPLSITPLARTEALSRELQRTRLALRAVEGRAREFFDRCPVLILILDGQGVIMDGNPAALRALCRPQEAILGQPLCDLAAPATRELLGRLLADLPEPASGPQELLLLTPGGTLTASATLSAVRAQDGTPVEIHLMMTDLSEVHRLQQRVYQADRLASVGQLAAGVAHEINNPAAFVLANLCHLQGAAPVVGRLLGCLDAVPDLPGLQDDERRRVRELIADLPEICAQSIQGMRRIRDIVRDLQVFARGADDAPEPLDCNGLCDTVANMAWLEIRRRARLEKDYGVLPPVLGHPGKLSQVLMNLVINAAQAIPEGNQAQHKIVLRTAPLRGGVAISVSDTGAGIPESVLPRIFDPFFTTKPAGKGTGLGLAVSYEIVRNHGGQIEVQSQVGQGTTFTVWLPAGEQAPVAPAKDEPAPEAVVAPQAQEPVHGKVLVIDDEPDFLRAIRRTLAPQHQVLLCGSGEEGLRILREQPDIDVVLCDLMMPEVSGMEVYERLPRALRQRLLFLSGDTGSAAVRAFLETLPVPPLTKPVEPELLRRQVEAAVIRRRC